jgi:RNA polymerase sigma-70 factor (ECF subfamily)
VVTESDQPTDRDLACRAITERDAFALLYDRYAARVYRFCYRRFGDRQEAEDATSAIFVRALERLDSYHGGSFPAWLFAIARTTVANRYRERAVGRLDDRAEIVDPGERPDETAIAAADATELRALLGSLSGEQREVIELRLAGLTGAEIAESMQRSVAATKMLQLRAMKRLRSIVGTAAGEEG